jgi:transportin-1
VQCLSSVVIAVGPGFANYADPVFSRCIRIIHSSLYGFQNYRSNPAMFPEPDRVFLICALDLLSALTQGLGAASQTLYSTSNPSVFPLLIFSLNVSFFAWS